MNISSATSSEINYWNITNNPPSMVSFLGFESNNQRQFYEWETNNNIHNTNTTTTTSTTTINTTTYNNSFLTTPNIFNCTSTNLPSSSTFGTSYPKLSDYSMAAEIIGLNLGRRTYFSSQESAVIDRLFKRPRGFYETNHVPKCQAEGCDMDLTNAKHYHRRHKVCEFHSKATKVLTGGLEQRFCQQCSRFHVLAEFDEGKRSCRKRLADHNRRRRKPPPPKTTEKGVSEVASSSCPRSEMKEKSLSSSASTHTPIIFDNTSSPCPTNATAKDSNGSLHALYAMGGEKQQEGDISHASATTYPQQESIFNNSMTMSLFDRDSSVSPYQNMFFSESNDEATPSMSGGGGGSGSDPSQHHQEDLQNLLHLGQALFEVDLL